MIVVIIILALAMLALASIRPHVSQLSDFELHRRCEEQDKAALLDWRRRQLYADLMTWRRLVVMCLLVVVVVLLTVRYDIWLAVLLGLLLVAIYPILAAASLVKAVPQRLYNRYELTVLDGVEALGGITKLLRREPGDSEFVPASRQEVQYIIGRSEELLKPDERKILAGAFDFADKRVKDYMTPRSKMEVIGAYEMLGPLVLDDLHKTGHSHFPVMDGDIDHIVGLLHLHNLLALTKKETVTVNQAMEPKVLFIHEDQTLDDALSVCIKHRRHLLVVVNDIGETVGVITIEDAVQQLVGRKIVDDNDDHDDVSKVAARHPLGESNSDKSLDA